MKNDKRNKRKVKEAQQDVLPESAEASEASSVSRVLRSTKKRRQIIIIAAALAVFVAVLVVGIYFGVNNNRTITVEFDSDEEVDAITVKKGDAPRLPVLTRDGYEFLGWYDEEERLVDDAYFLAYDFKADLVLHDKWRVLGPVTVTFVSRGGSTVDPVEVPRGYALTTMPQSERSGFYLLGWCYDEQCLRVYNPDTDVISAPTTLYAKWILREIGELDTVEVVYNAGAGAPVKTATVQIGTAFEHAQSYCAGYEFGGWYSDNQYRYPVDERVVLTQSCVVYAKWDYTDKICTLQFVTDGNVLSIDPQTYPVYTTLTENDMPRPQWAGFEFGGYYWDASYTEAVELPLVVRADDIVYLRYIDANNVYVDVTFYITEDNYVINSVKKGAHIDYLTPPTRQGYTFDAWYADQACTIPFDFDNSVAANGLCIYANWLTEVAYIDDYFTYTLSEDETYLIATAEVDRSADSLVVADVVNGKPVKAIAPGLFYARVINTITIGANVEVIGDNAFDSCLLTSISLPASVREIGNSAFYHAYFLESVEALGRVSVGTRAFYNCESLRSVKMPYVTSVGDYAFSESTVRDVEMTYGRGAGETPLYLGTGAFLNCSRLTSVDFSQSNLEEFGVEAFRGCTSLSTIGFGNTVKVLRNGCFADTHLTTFNCKNIERIEHNVFNNCSVLQSVTIRAPLVSIEPSCFEKCYALERINVIDNTHYLSNAADGCLYSADGTQLLLYVGVSGEYTLPAEVASISYEAFLLANNIESISVDASNTHFQAIDGNLYSADGKTLVYFAAAKTDSQFVVPDGVESVRCLAFAFSSSLNEVYLADTVKSVDFWAFYNLNNLQHVYCTDEDMVALITVSHSAEDMMASVYECPLVVVSVVQDE